MSRPCRMAFAAAVALVLAGPAAAQPPGFGKGRGPDQKPAAAPKPDPAVADQVKAIEEKLAKLKEAEAELTAKLKELKGGAGKPAAGGFGPGQFGLEMGGPWMGGLGFRGGFNFDRMDAAEVKELMTKLQKVLDEKAKGDKPKAVEKPAKPAPNQDEVLKRLDQLSKELDELRRAIKK